MRQATDRAGLRDSFSLGRVRVGLALGIVGGTIALALLLHLAGCST